MVYLITFQKCKITKDFPSCQKKLKIKVSSKNVDSLQICCDFGNIFLVGKISQTKRRKESERIFPFYDPKIQMLQKTWEIY